MIRLGLSSGILVVGFVGTLGCGSGGGGGIAGAGGAALTNGHGNGGNSVIGSTGGTVSGTGNTPGVGTGSIPSGTGAVGTTGPSGTGGSSFPGFGSGGSTGVTGSGGISTGTGATPGTGTGGTGTGTGGTGTGTGGTTSGMTTGPIPHGACLDGITDFTKDGPFMVTPKPMSPINYYVPSVPPGCKVPVVHLANGTGASCAVYQPALQRLASHGFLAACYESPNTGAGDQGLQALDTALKAFPDLADTKFGSTGHSQGGQASFTVLALAEKKYGGDGKWVMAGLAMEPASGFGVQPTGTTWQALYAGIKSPMFMFSGLGTDGLVSQGWVQQAYDAMSKTVEAYFWTASGATHIPVPNGEEEEISIPWFRWKLLGDQAACKAFKAIPMTDKKWAQVAAKNEQQCM